MTTSPGEPVENDQSGHDDADPTGPETTDDGSADRSGGGDADSTDPSVDDSELPEDLRPGPDNPLAVNPDEESGGEGATSGAGGAPPEDSADDADQPTNDPTGGTPL